MLKVRVTEWKLLEKKRLSKGGKRFQARQAEKRDREIGTRV